MKSIVTLGLGLAAITAATAWAAKPDVSAVVRVDQPGHTVPKTLYGIFFEDINYAADGGIYAELIANRGFDWMTTNLEAWKKDFRGEGAARLSRQSGFPVHPNSAQYLRIEVFHPGKDAAGVGVSNGGFGGIALKQGARYDLSFYARPHQAYSGGLTLALESGKGEVLARFRLDSKDWKNQQPATRDASPLDPSSLANWVRYTAELVPTATVADARLVVLCDAPGIVDIDLVSLFPHDTYGRRPNGLRADLVELLKEMKPGSMRFPGGCIVEGTDLNNLYDWKRTVGPIERRTVNPNLWGYWQSGGLGFYEYFLLAEDIGAEPLPILAAGMSCQFRKSEILPLDGLGTVIQDALDLIEFANGPADSPWGKVRADMGHPESFELKMLGIGNENWSQVFLDRYAIISKAVKAKHPEIEIVSSAGAGPAGAEYDLAWKTLPKLGADWVDEHYYVSADWLFGSNKRYDHFDRKGPKVYVGEYACHLPDRSNSIAAALAEAAMMTGFERNSDIVGMTAYAPLFNKVGSTQWAPDLIWFDNTRAYGTPSYHVQKLFMRHLPDVILPISARTEPKAMAPTGRIGLQTWNTSADFRDIRVTSAGKTLYAFDPARGLDGWSAAQEGKWEVVDGTLRQTDAKKTKTTILLGDPLWKDYTIRLKARKRSGEEGFIVRLRDQNNGHVHVNFGGWGNTAHGIERDGSNPIIQKPGSIEPNRWYDIEISLAGDRVSAKVDGKSVFDHVAVPAGDAPDVFMVSGYDKTNGEIIVKCVNARNEPSLLQLDLAGANVPPQQARRITLAGDASAINDLDHPDHVTSVEDAFTVSGPEVKIELKANSLTILRCKATLPK